MVRFKLSIFFTNFLVQILKTRKSAFTTDPNFPLLKRRFSFMVICPEHHGPNRPSYNATLGVYMRIPVDQPSVFAIHDITSIYNEIIALPIII